MAAYTLNCSARNAQPIGQQAIGAAEDVITVRAIQSPMYRNKATIQIRSSQAFRYSKTAGVASATVGWPVDANQAFTLTFADAEVFYVFGAAAGTIEFLVVGD